MRQERIETCGDESDKLYYHVFQFLPLAYILTWGVWVLFRRGSLSRSGSYTNEADIPPPDDGSHQVTTNPITSDRDRSHKASFDPISGVPRFPHRGSLVDPGMRPSQGPVAEVSSEEELDETDTHRAFVPVDARPRCLRGFWFKAFCMVVHLSEAATSAVAFAFFTDDSNAVLLSVSLVIEVFLWLWAAGVLSVSPAEQHCTLPLFWALMLNTNLMRVCEISAYGLSDPFGELLLSKIVLNGILVLSTWRVYLGLIVAPLLALVVLAQFSVRGFQMLCARCCKSSQASTEQESVRSSLQPWNPRDNMLEEPLLPNDETIPADETMVEVVIYELWPSNVPCYIGKYLGAYHTGIAADVDHRAGPLEYTFEVPDGVKPRRRGRRPVYVQGDGKTYFPVGRCKKATFKQAVAKLRESQRFSEGESYRILTNNCHAFCDELLDLLGPTVTGRVPFYARFLDDMLGFLIPGGTLQGIENFLEDLGEDEEQCDRRCLLFSILGCLACILIISVPAAVLAHLSLA